MAGGMKASSWCVYVERACGCVQRVYGRVGSRACAGMHGVHMGAAQAAYTSRSQKESDTNERAIPKRERSHSVGRSTYSAPSLSARAGACVPA